MDLINFKPSLEKSDDFEPIYFADTMTYWFQIGILNLILINQKILNSDPSTSLYNQRVMRVKSLDFRSFPFPMKLIQLCRQSPSPSMSVTSISVPIGCSSSSKLESGFTGNIYGFSQLCFLVICLRSQFLSCTIRKNDYHVIISSKLPKMICF